MTSRRWKFPLAILLTAGLWSAASGAADPPAWAVPTFESLGLYYNRAVAQNACRLRYRIANTSAWRDGQSLVYDQCERQYRGSLVGLTPDTLYDVRLESDGPPVDFQARTLAEKFPIGKTTYLPAGSTDQALRIQAGGTAKGWRLVAPAEGGKFVSDVFNLS